MKLEDQKLDQEKQLKALTKQMKVRLMLLNRVKAPAALSLES